eukprot:Protomagalhaensia_wolfi_Nauph_80__967@NODE_155_length_3392_cov_108_496570_g116_i0_p3_GENE_NODE_155_length_3392_cov_108_496570_g116_i0NODE_155_length_3392_cov_108_496570_g116_i0_p3_ORF_typecomplete_len168_score22_66GST_N_3/PF13417_6/1_4e05Glutaredoxin/PF00462_24/0_086Glutaredoxin/PF00462_24/3_5e03DUF3797/PF12677_7/0_65DUF3797/PF12677_7/6_3e02_NODE_155_length_3392_cov_108_496570_g116_i013291832
MSAPATGHVHTPAVPDDRLYFKPVPNLYIYDHCPYCVKARMIFGIRNIKVNLVFFANDDFEGPINLIGKKAVPILEYSHCGKRVVMPESGDIVRHVDTSPEFQGGAPTVSEGKKTQEISKVFWCTPDVKDLFFSDNTRANQPRRVPERSKQANFYCSSQALHRRIVQ